ncbi:hypothetical protein GN956_G425 [Arapaima gigas]
MTSSLGSSLLTRLFFCLRTFVGAFIYLFSPHQKQQTKLFPNTGVGNRVPKATLGRLSDTLLRTINKRA